MALAVGKKAPEFTLAGSNGEDVSLKDFKGKTVVLYFYPKDDTPGCTKEACDFRDSWTRVTHAGAVVLGVSADSVASHDKFKEKYDLPFPLLSDRDHKVSTDYGTWSGLGYLLGDAVKDVPYEGRRVGAALAVLAVGGIVGYVTFKWVRRRRFLRRLWIARISPDDLRQTLESDTPMLIIDLRSELDVGAEPYVIPGALRIAAEELERRHAEIPRDREVVVYCS